MIGIQHYFFYFENNARNEKGLFITYRYPYKDQKRPLSLLGLLISLSHREVRPCVQKCILSSEKLLLDSPEIGEFLQMEYGIEKDINTSCIKYLDRSSDKKLYEWIKSLDS